MNFLIYAGNFVIAFVGGILFFWQIFSPDRSGSWLSPLVAVLYAAAAFWLTSPSNFARSEGMIRWHLYLAAAATLAIPVFCFGSILAHWPPDLALAAMVVEFMGAFEHALLVEACDIVAKRSLYSVKGI